MNSKKLALFTSVAVMTAFVGQSSGEIIRNITVKGNQRVEVETLTSYMTLKTGAEFSQAQLDESLIALFDTGLFADVNLKHLPGTIEVQVTENPIINRISFEGNKRVTDEVFDAEVKLKPRQVYTLSKVQADTQTMLDIYRVRGNFAAKVEPKIIKQDQNRVDLVFEIDEGPVTVVRKIFFVGNKSFSESKLEETIQTKESRWYRFFTNDDTYDPDRMSYDKDLLRKFYLQNGYADFKVTSGVAELSPQKEDFYLTYTISEGERYKFGSVDIKCSLKNVDMKELQSLVTIEKDSWYSSKDLEALNLKLTDALGAKGYAFVDVKPQIAKDSKTKHINITYDIQQAPRVFIDRIVIKGNDVTHDDVIRREIQLSEGDAYNALRLKKSEQRIKDLGFFKKVTITREPSQDPDKMNLIVEVEEQSTGELSLAAAFSTDDGLGGNVQYTQRNFRGRGQELRTNFSISKRKRDFDIGFTEPYFLDRPLVAGINVFNLTRKRANESSYDYNTMGLGLNLGYELSPDWLQNWSYTLQRDKTDNVDKDASEFVQAMDKKATISSIAHTIAFDRRDSRKNPTDGYVISLTNTFAGVGGDVKFLKNDLRMGWYYPVTEEVIFNLSGRGGIMSGLGKNTRVVDRYMMGGDTLRGFEPGGVGPRDRAKNKDALGGLRYYGGSAEFTFPVGLPQEFGLKGHLFADAGTLWKSDLPLAKVYDENKLRTSVGFGLSWKSPFGPIRIDFTKALKKQNYDKTQVFNLGMSTHF